MKALLKLSGQALKAGGADIVDRDYLWQLAGVFKQAQTDGHQIAIVIGGGNIYRFAANRRDPRDERLDHTLADGRGLLAILFNGMWLQDVFTASGVQSALFSSSFVDERFARQEDRDAERTLLDAGAVVIYGGGTGQIGVSTDVAAIQIAHELAIDTILKATHTVDGVYSADPVGDPTARKIETLTFQQALTDKLAIMDERALQEAEQFGQTIHVFSLADPTTLTRVLAGETIGSVISKK